MSKLSGVSRCSPSRPTRRQARPQYMNAVHEWRVLVVRVMKTKIWSESSSFCVPSQSIYTQESIMMVSIIRLSRGCQCRNLNASFSQSHGHLDSCRRTMSESYVRRTTSSHNTDVAHDVVRATRCRTSSICYGKLTGSPPSTFHNTADDTIIWKII